MALETKLWDPADRLTTPEAISAYLDAALEDGDPDVVVAALDDIMRACASGNPGKSAEDKTSRR